MLYDQIQETCAFIQSKIDITPSIGIILGSGLTGLTTHLNKTLEIPYESIPNFPLSTVEGHEGKLMFGTLGGKFVAMMSGRFHYYEGYNMQEITFPVRVMKALGVSTLMVSNAAGGMNKDFKVGDIMLIRDHINHFPENPLRGKNDPRLGLRFPDMSEPYCLDYIEKVKIVAQNNGIEVKEGVYVGLQGPTFETKAEYFQLHVIGGDAVGMSTVPEVIVGIHSQMKIFAASIITDMGLSDKLEKITHEEVLEAAQIAAPKLALLMAGLVEAI